MKSLEKTGLGTPRTGLCEIRFTNHDGETEAWVLGATVDEIQALRRFVAKAYIDDGTDTRIGEQANAIGRLTKHVAWHHDDLGVTMAEDCTFMKRAWSGFEGGTDGSATQA